MDKTDYTIRNYKYATKYVSECTKKHDYDYKMNVTWVNKNKNCTKYK